MSVLQALVLGFVQGATEFLPISSSGHLVLVPWALGWEFDSSTALTFSVIVHWGTLLAVVAAMWTDLARLLRAWVRGLRHGAPLDDPDSRLTWLLLLASIPAALLGLLLGSVVEATFGAPQIVAALLIANAGVLLLGERLARRASQLSEAPSLGALDAVVIGLAQSTALFPGISRSGATITGGLSRGLDRVNAARTSFLLAVPIMVGAGVATLVDLGAGWQQMGAPLLVGFVTAALVGFAAVRWLLRYLSSGFLTPFAVYCAAVGVGALLLYALRP